MLWVLEREQCDGSPTRCVSHETDPLRQGDPLLHCQHPPLEALGLTGFLQCLRDFDKCFLITSLIWHESPTVLFRGAERFFGEDLWSPCPSPATLQVLETQWLLQTRTARRGQVRPHTITHQETWKTGARLGFALGSTPWLRDLPPFCRMSLLRDTDDGERAIPPWDFSQPR